MKSKRLVIAAFICISAITAISPSIAKADVHVYDNNDQHLGILIEMWSSRMDLFIPSLGGVFHYTTDYSGWCSDELTVLFQSTDCSGTPYASEPFPQIFDFSPTPMKGFYKVDYNGKQTFTPGSYYDINCNCRLDPGEPNAEYYPYVEVQMPFTTPIEFPLSFKVRTKSVVVPFF